MLHIATEFVVGATRVFDWCGIMMSHAGSRCECFHYVKVNMQFMPGVFMSAFDAKKIPHRGYTLPTFHSLNCINLRQNKRYFIAQGNKNKALCFWEMHNATSISFRSLFGDSVLNCKVDDYAWLAADANNRPPSASASSALLRQGHRQPQQPSR